jgi:hypothetical protein
LRALSERRLTAAELEAWLRAPMDARERDEIVSLRDWFVRRYPTPAARLASIRRSLPWAEELARAGRAR